MKRIYVTLLILLVVSASCAFGQASKPRRARSHAAAKGCGVHCGTERWAIKTLSDPNSGSASNATPTDRSISDLTSESAPATLPATSRVSPIENQQFKVHAVLIGWKIESDQDFHLVLADPADHNKTLIAEIPSPTCSGACSSTRVGDFGAARRILTDALGQPNQTFTALSPPKIVDVTGVGFFDFAHGQDGLAPNCIELHPVLNVAIVGDEAGGPIPLPTKGVKHTCGTAGGRAPKHRP